MDNNAAQYYLASLRDWQLSEMNSFPVEEKVLLKHFPSLSSDSEDAVSQEMERLSKIAHHEHLKFKIEETNNGRIFIFEKLESND
ncbi:MAG TPA: hypothetical protein VF648_00505 [Pyrinomonadaceae bacterium]